MPKLTDTAPLGLSEPRLLHIARQLQSLLTMVELEKDGEPVQVNGFRLRDLAMWVTARSDSSFNAIAPISGLCNSRCAFCVEHGVPFARDLSVLPVAEARTRLKYYSLTTGGSLFCSGRPHMEAFANPEAVEIIRMAREHDASSVFWITTNGLGLDRKTVEQLAALKPMVLKLSLNAIDPEFRCRLMGAGQGSETALAAPKLLQEYRVPFVGSLVAWPTVPMGSIGDTVQYLESCHAYSIRIRLPLVHRWMREQPAVDLSYWESIIDYARQLASKCCVPLLVEPTVYWITPVVPEVDGVILNSPAYRAGIRSHDIVQSINGHSVMTRSESDALLYDAHTSHRPVDLEVSRAGRQLAFRLETGTGSQDTYPFDSEHYYRRQAYGVLHTEDFRLRCIREVFDLIDRYEARRVLLFTSPAVGEVFRTLVANIPELAERLQHVEVLTASGADSAFGGNFAVSDARLVEDYARTIRSHLAEGARPDLILIPSAFGSGWGVDLCGVSYSRLPIEFGIPVELIPWHFIYGRDV